MKIIVQERRGGAGSRFERFFRTVASTGIMVHEDGGRVQTGKNKERVDLVAVYLYFPRHHTEGSRARRGMAMPQSKKMNTIFLRLK